MKFIYFNLLLLVATIVSSQNINQMDENGERHGVWKKNFDKTKILRYEGEFSHGKEVGLFKFYQNLGGQSVLTATRNFHDNDGLADVQFFSSTGKLISEGLMNGKLYIGIWKYYQKGSNTLLNLENYNDSGMLEGERLVYYENGQIAQKENYNKGILQGISYWYAENGVLIKEETYDNNQLHGLSKYYNPEGVLIIEGLYKQGKKHGFWKYYEDGKLVEEKNFSPAGKYKKK